MTSKELHKPKLNLIAKKMFPIAQDRINAGKCPLCNAEINGVDEFKDEASFREYGISGMCQKCQDKTFG
ncbi:MAG: hypothetical protein ACTSPB_07320 [Candidatus Thorarchaeota archaeon]